MLDPESSFFFYCADTSQPTMTDRCTLQSEQCEIITSLETITSVGFLCEGAPVPACVITAKFSAVIRKTGTLANCMQEINVD